MIEINNNNIITTTAARIFYRVVRINGIVRNSGVSEMLAPPSPLHALFYGRIDKKKKIFFSLAQGRACYINRIIYLSARRKLVILRTRVLVIMYYYYT